MERYAGISEARLLQRIERLDQEERDLHQRTMDYALQAETEGRAATSDARYGLLLAAAKSVHEEMLHIEAELLRRSAMAYPAVQGSPAKGSARDRRATACVGR